MDNQRNLYRTAHERVLQWFGKDTATPVPDETVDIDPE